MLKGCQKRMIFVRDTGSELFDEAYFILKRDIPYDESLEDDIVRTATAIINQNPFPKSPKRVKKNCKALFCFLLGLIIGIAGMGVFSLIF